MLLHGGAHVEESTMEADLVQIGVARSVFDAHDGEAKVEITEKLSVDAIRKCLFPAECFFCGSTSSPRYNVGTQCMLLRWCR